MGLGLSGGNGLRVKKVSGRTTTVYIFSGSKVIAEYDNGAAVGSPSREYVYGGSALLAKIDSTGMKYYHQDQLSNRLVTSSTGAVLEQMGHYPFGDPWYNASNDKLLFTSYERDSESSNDYAQARFFRWLIGSFLSPDPLPGSTSDPQSLNRYTYVENNPIGFVDPSGAMEEESCDDSVDDSCGGGGGGGDGFCLGCDVGWMPASGDLGAPLPAGKTGLLGTLLNILGSIFSGAGQGGVGDGGQDLWMTSATLGGYTSPDPFNATSTGFGLGPIVGGGGSGSGPQKPQTTSKHYGLTTPCTSTASQVMGKVESNFSQFGNYSRWGGLESVTFSPPAGMGVGSTIPINVGIAFANFSLSVTVQSMNSQSMTFTTNPGHMLYPASITFAASPASPGSINFNINLGGTIANPNQFRFGGSNFEDAQWNHFLGQVGSFCKAGG